MKVVSWCAIAMLTVCSIAIAEEPNEVLKFEIPDPYFGGTPLDYFGSNLEEPNYKKRPDFNVPAGTTNVAKGKTVTASVAKTEYGKLEMLVDDDKHYQEESLVGLAEGVQWVQIDLGSVHTLYAFALWHFHEGDRVYFDVIVRVSNDPSFKEFTEVFNNDHDNSAKLNVGKDKEYIESYKSKFIDMKKAKGQYVRFYSNGNTSDNFNNYVEAAVFGKPAK
jgi:hypothetical protein